MSPSARLRAAEAAPERAHLDAPVPLPDALADELAAWRDAGLGRALALPEGRDFTSNGYLSLSHDPRVIAAARSALERFGAGAPGSRLLRGHGAAHAAAERAAAGWIGTEAALLFPSGFMANQAVLTTLLGDGDVILSDRLNHASIIDGCRLSRAETVLFPHGDLGALDARLREARGARRRLIVVETATSMDGTLADVDGLVELARRHDAWIHLDHAHAAGLLPGLVRPAERVISHLVTGGKALGIAGAFVAASRDVVELLVNRGRAFVFTTAVPPSTAAALAAAIEVAQAEPERGERALSNAARLRRELAARGVEAGGATAIVPVVLGEAGRAMAVAERVRAAGFDVRAVRPPTVAPGTSRIRIVCHADHEVDELDGLASALAEAVRREPETARPERLETTIDGSPRPAHRGPGGPPHFIVANREPVRKIGSGRPADQGATASAPGRCADALVVCGTDTGVGKTVASALLVRAVHRSGRPVRYLKPVQTGCDEDCDTATVRALAGLDPEHARPPVVALPLPASIDQAALDAGRPVTLAEVLEGTRARLGDPADAGALFVVELAGGLRVPINDREDQADLAVALGAPIVLVARSGLGTLNHTLLTVEAARARGLDIRAVLLAGERHAANEATLGCWLGPLPLVSVPSFPELDDAALDAFVADGPLDAVLAEVLA